MREPRKASGAEATTRSRLGRVLFPRGVRVRHFVLLPAVGMALAVGASRALDHWIGSRLTGIEAEVFQAARTVAVALAMSSLIAFLAIQYRSSYEARLQAHNEALEVTRDFLSRIIEGSGEAIVTRDLNGRVTSWNRAAEAIYGYNSQEMLGQTVDRLIPRDPESLSTHERAEQALARGQNVFRFEASRIRKDGKPITVAITMAPIRDHSGERAGTTGIVRDVTALKEMEARLLERETLAAVGELAAVVAHEVRNPLAGIRGGCEILLEGYPEKDARHEIGREVIHQVDRLNRMVQDLLLFARPRAVSPLPTDLHALLDRLLSVFGDDPDNHALGIRREYGSDVPVVCVDARQMEQVFLNLFLNAAQAMERRGEIAVVTRSVGQAVQVSVRDTGPGIPPDKLDQIFKPFFTTRAQGTGLGLAICKKIVEAHGGRIDVETKPGQGTQLSVTLPRAE